MKQLHKSIFLLAVSVYSTLSLSQQLDIKWLGGPTLLIEFGTIQLLTDPMLGQGDKAFKMADPNENFDLSKGPTIKDHARIGALPDFNQGNIDVVLIGHTHEDHFDQVAQKELSKTLPLISPESDATLIKGLGFSNHIPLTWGKSWDVSEGDYHIKITAIPAYHTENHALEEVIGHGNGYWLEFTHQDWKRSVYWMGDSFLTPELLSLLTKYDNPDLFIPHVGRVGTTGPLGQLSMGADDVIDAIKYLKPKRTLPSHHSTYALYLEPISVLIDKAQVHNVAVDVIAEGSWVSYR
ncbi:MBL fold metallo-hydrolase [Marinomonas sp. C2222]|uniref:MBL fold metallo-hydrolase n=1 Tax=Marinomonas sargassi TaxID=2984494 RepID=A0ABT2YTJ3_9GAMM|nr:MBL fold metallo-hydrolase [Marinomonas sargassi]MCV2403212.1 MBL fold metallo-hydrolase [Marinomonas sargassi]